MKTLLYVCIARVLLGWISPIGNIKTIEIGMKYLPILPNYHLYVRPQPAVTLPSMFTMLHYWFPAKYMHQGL